MRKPCSKCGTTDFPKYRQGGKFCILCRKEDQKEWARKRDKDHRNKVMKAYRAKNKARINAYQRDWYRANKLRETYGAAEETGFSIQEGLCE